MTKRLGLFISYSRRDISFVDRLQMDLSSRGYEVWVDRRMLKGGRSWEQQLRDAILRAEIFLIIVSPDSMNSEFVLDEFNFAMGLSKRIFPVIYREVIDHAKIPMRLGRMQWVVFANREYMLAFEELTNALPRAENFGVDAKLDENPGASTVIDNVLQNRIADSSRRMLVYILLDISQEVCGEPLAAMEKGLEFFIRELHKSPEAIETVHIRVVAYSDDFEIVTPLIPILNFETPTLKCGGSNDIGRAYRQLDVLLKTDFRPRKSSDSFFDYKPIVIVLTTSNPRDLEKAMKDAKLLLNRPWGYELGAFVALLAGLNVDADTWKPLAMQVVSMSNVTSEDLVQFFQWIEPNLLIDGSFI